MSVQTIDDDAADFIVVPVGDASLLVAEDASGTLPATDSYRVRLAHAPSGPVTFLVSADGQTEISATVNGTYSQTLELTFADATTTRTVFVRAKHDTIKEALHFSRLTQAITSDLGAFLGLGMADVAGGLRAAIDGDPTARYDAEVTGGNVTITGRRAFTASTFNGSILSSVPAYTGTLTVALDTTSLAIGRTWSLTLDGVDFEYIATNGDTPELAASGLAAAINVSERFRATPTTGGALQVVRLDAAPYVARMAAADGALSATGASTTHFAEVVISLNTLPGGIAPEARWTITLDGIDFHYIAGRHGEGTVPAPLDVRITDDDAPGVLVIETGNGTNVTEPSYFVVLGDGFVTEVLTGHTFKGDFGTAILGESSGNSSRLTAQDLELGKWNRNTHPNFADLVQVAGESQVQFEPHLTVRGTGNGNSDWFRFKITQAMIDTAGGNGVQATFDIDGGYGFGDPILWLSLLRVYNAAGDLLAQGDGMSDPFALGQSGKGSTTWLDDFLAHTFTEAGEYYVEVGAWLFSSAPPNGVDYELNITVENHPTAGLLFAPAPVLENEGGNNDPASPQQIIADNFFKFYDPTIGDRWAMGGTIDWMTSYARIQGSGDGSYDLYSFHITDEMLNPEALTSTTALAAAADTSRFFTSASLRLTGRVTAGDVWKLGIRYREYTYMAQTDDTLTDVAAGLAAAIALTTTRYTLTVAGDTLRIQDPYGFNLQGLSINGNAQQAFAAAKVARTQTARDDAGTPLELTSASVALGGSAAEREIWSVAVGGKRYDHIVAPGGSTDLADIAASLAAAINDDLDDDGTTAGAVGATLTIARPMAFTLQFTTTGASPQGSAALSGTPAGAQQTADIDWTELRIAIGATVRAGERYELVLTNLGGTSRPPIVRVAGSTDGTLLRDALLDGVDDLPAAQGYSAVIDGTTLVIRRAAGFSATLTITPSGGVAEGTAPTRTVTITGAYGTGDTWNLTLADGATVLGTASATGASADAVATSLAASINGNAGFHAIAQGATVTIVSTGGSAFNTALSVDIAGSAPVGDTSARVITFADFATTDGWSLALGAETYASTADTKTLVATDLAAQINGDADAPFAAKVSGESLIVFSTAAATFTPSLTVTPAVQAGTAATTQTWTLGGTPAAGQTWTLTVDTEPVTATGNANLTDVAAALAAAVNADADLTSYVARSSGATITITRFGGAGAIVASVAAPAAGAATLTAGTPSVRAEAFSAAGTVTGDDWTLILTEADGTVIESATVSDLDASPTAELTAALQALAHFDAEASGTTLRVTRVDGTGDFRLQVVVTKTGAIAAARPAHTITYGGAVVDGDVYAVAVNGTASNDAAASFEVTADAADASAVAAGIASDLDGDDAYHAVAKGTLVVVSRQGSSEDFTVGARTVDPAGRSQRAAAGTETFTITGTINSGDTWQLLDGTTVLATTSAAATAAALLAALQAADTNSAYTAFVLGSTLYVTRITGAPDLSVAVTRHGTDPVLSGTLVHDYQHDVTLDPAGEITASAGDTWTITIGAATRTVSPAAGETTSQIIDRLVTALSGGGAINGITASNVGGKLHLVATGGALIDIDPIIQFRPNAGVIVETTEFEVADDQVRIVDGDGTQGHFSSASVELKGDFTGGEKWTIRIDRDLFVFTAPSADSLAPANRTLRRIAEGLVAAINTGSTVYGAEVLSAGLGRIRVFDKSGANDPFTVTVSRGGGEVLGLVDIDRSTLVQGEVIVPVVRPEFQFLVELYPYLAAYFSTADTLAYTARPDIRVYNKSATGLAPACSTVAGTDPGSATADDPFLRCVFSQAGDYVVEVGSFVDYADFTSVLGVANTYRLDGHEGVVPGASYDLVVSLERHEINPEQISLADKFITVVEGAGKGQTAKILDYDPESRTYTLDRDWVGIDETSRFEIAQGMGDFPSYEQTSDSYDVVLTGRPGQDVLIDVAPRRTRTYNSDKAFDPAANFGEAEEVQVRVATQQAHFRLSGSATAGEHWNVALGSLDLDAAHTVPFSYAVLSTGTALTTIAARLVQDINGSGTGFAAVLDTDGLGFTVTNAGVAFYADFAITPDSRGGAQITSEGAQKVVVGLNGIAQAGEVWHLSVNGVDSVYTVGFREDLATIAAKLGAALQGAQFDVVVVGRQLTITRDDGGAVAALFRIEQDSAGAATVTAQLALHRRQLGSAPDRLRGGGRRRVRRRRRRDRVPGLRAARQPDPRPVIINGDIGATDERFLNNPLLLPGEKNLPIPDGRLGTVGTIDGLGTITDLLASHVNALTGERPGFDPRMSDYAYTLSLLDGAAAGREFDVKSVSQDVLSVGRQTPFPVGFSFTGAVDFLGTPDQAALGSIHWSEATVALTGLARAGEVWTLTVGGAAYSTTVLAEDAVPSRVAQRLAALLTGSPYDVEVRIGLLGDSRLIIRQKTPTPGGFTVGFGIAPDGAHPVQGKGVVGGSPIIADIGAAQWTMAAFRFRSGGTINLTLGGTTFTATGATVEALTAALRRSILTNTPVGTDYAPLVSGTRVTLNAAWPTIGAGQLLPGAGDKYVIKPLNLNRRVVDADQVDTVNVYNGDSPSDDTGTLTSDRLTGLGMGDESIIDGRSFVGGLQYLNIEALNIHLGSGNDTLTIESTHAGSTTVSGNDGDDRIVVKTIDGHTTLLTGAGDDVVRVSSDEGTVDQITALLTIDAGAGTDTVTVDDAADTNDNVAILTPTTLTGMDMPTVAQVFSVFLQARSGTYKLTVGTNTVTISLTSDLGHQLTAAEQAAMRAEIEAKLRLLYGITDLKVALAPPDVGQLTYYVTFTRELAAGPYAVADDRRRGPHAEPQRVRRREDGGDPRRHDHAGPHHRADADAERHRHVRAPLRAARRQRGPPRRPHRRDRVRRDRRRGPRRDLERAQPEQRQPGAAVHRQRRGHAPRQRAARLAPGRGPRPRDPLGRRHRRHRGARDAPGRDQLLRRRDARTSTSARATTS